LAAIRLSARDGTRDYAILREQISKEPSVRRFKRGDEEWLVLLKWIYFATIGAEELGVTRKNLHSKTQTKIDLRLEKFLAESGAFAKQLGVNPG
jgi:general L-amino acid transport system substrate-binding protein